jgi:hypothetical protein
MHCDCEILPTYTYYDHERGISQKLRPFTEPVAFKTSRELFRCEICGTFWRIDVPDKFQQRYVWKVGEYRDDWASAEFVEEQKQLLLQRRGGIADETCVWAGCDNKRVKGMAICIDHLYANGARR